MTCAKVLFLALFLAGATQAQAYPVVLQVNQYYVLYTHPVPPYLDSSGRVMVNLFSFAQMLLDNKPWWLPLPLEYDPATRSATLGFQGRRVRFQEGVAEAQLSDGTNLKMPVAPVILPQGRIAVPLATLAQAFGLKLTWDPELKLARLEGEGLLGIEAGFLKNLITTPETRELVPQSVWVDPQMSGEPWIPTTGRERLSDQGGREMKRWDYHLWVRDLSSSGIPPEAEGIFLIKRQFDYGLICTQAGLCYHVWGIRYSGRQRSEAPGHPASQPCSRRGNGYLCESSIAGAHGLPALLITARMTVNPDKLSHAPGK